MSAVIPSATLRRSHRFSSAGSLSSRTDRRVEGTILGSRAFQPVQQRAAGRLHAFCRRPRAPYSDVRFPADENRGVVNEPPRYLVRRAPWASNDHHWLADHSRVDVWESSPASNASWLAMSSTTTKRSKPARIPNINTRVISQPMMIIRGPRCAPYQVTRRLIHDPTVLIGREAHIGVREPSVDDRTHATYQQRAAGLAGKPGYLRSSPRRTDLFSRTATPPKRSGVIDVASRLG